MGCYEFLTALQSWRDGYFGLPDGGTGAGNADDWDSDGVRNLVEYSQGMNPTQPDAQLAPTGTLEAGSLRFKYRKSAPELGYAVKTSPDLSVWGNAVPAEQTDGAGSFWRDFPFAPGKLFMRLEVNQ